MTTEEKILLATVSATAVLVVLGAALGGSAWLWLLITIALLGLLGWVAGRIRRRERMELLRKDHVPPPVEEVEQQPEVEQTTLADVRLPSAADGYHFHFSATAYWRPIGGSALQHANLAGLAADAIVARARAVTATEQPSSAEVVAHRLAGALGAVQRDTSGGVHTWADQVRLTLSEADQARLRRLADVRKDEDIWEHERDHERSKRAYLGDDVLKSPGSAVVWWLVQKDNDVAATMPLLGDLAQLSAVANNAELPELFRHLVPTPAPLCPDAPEAGQFANGRFPDGNRQTSSAAPWADVPAEPFGGTGSVTNRFGALLDTLRLSDDERALLARRFAVLIEKQGRPEQAQEIQRHFDSPLLDDEPVPVPEPDGDPQDRPAPDGDPPAEDGFRPAG